MSKCHFKNVQIVEIAKFIKLLNYVKIQKSEKCTKPKKCKKEQTKNAIRQNLPKKMQKNPSKIKKKYKRCKNAKNKKIVKNANFAKICKIGHWDMTYFQTISRGAGG